jgi:hypothetical protein
LNPRNCYQNYNVAVNRDANARFTRILACCVLKWGMPIIPATANSALYLMIRILKPRIGTVFFSAEPGICVLGRHAADPAPLRSANGVPHAAQALWR